jgi:hypothetical protein
LTARGRDLEATLADIRAYSAGCRLGTPESFTACKNLIQLLLDLTVAATGQHVSVQTRDRGSNVAIVRSMRDVNTPLLLRDDNFLRVAISLVIEPTDQGPRMKVSKSAFQYQRDRPGDEWIFRYDYVRVPGAKYRHPAAHLQVRGELDHGDPTWSALKDLHFATSRVSFEAVLMTLMWEFGVPSNEPEEFWRAALSEAERAFAEIAHRPIAGA